ncbi:hypothetical protein FHR22_003998 [Sphingopyxis panaciterrae]|nr:recombinase family protein [Sphingopyxis panaciterrae]NIJ39251.1 hypothetical protein [Sphingopyxis panaciterrae]
MLGFVREGDTIVVSRLDRFARSLSDLFQMLDTLTSKSVAFQCLHQSIDTGTSTGKLTLAILGAVAEFENDLRRERQREGIAKAKASGTYKGRKPSIDLSMLHDLRDAGLGLSAIALQMPNRTNFRWRRLFQQRRSKWKPKDALERFADLDPIDFEHMSAVLQVKPRRQELST